MDDKLYKETFDAAINELSELMEQREELDNRREELNERISKVRTGVLALSPLIGEEPKSVENKYPHLFPDLIPSDIGLTDAVRKVLQSYGKLLTPVGVRVGLKATGYDTDRYKNVLASIHTVLKRLVEAGEVEPGSINDAPAYKWKNSGTKMFKQGIGTTVYRVNPDLMKRMQESAEEVEKIIIENERNSKKK